MSSPEPSPRRRIFSQDEFHLDALLVAKGTTTISVVIPARNEEATIGSVIDAVAQCSRLVDEIVVVDDMSTDSTAAQHSTPAPRLSRVPEHGSPGKGRAMDQGLRVARGDIVLFLDGDVSNCGPHFVSSMVGPLLLDPEILMVKAAYQRPLDGVIGEGGRVTELVAKPLIAALFPDLSFLSQPLSGECAVRREALREACFPHGYGVEMELLIHVSRTFGSQCIAESDLGIRIHRNRPLSELTSIARAVTDVALRAAGYTEQFEFELTGSMN